MFISYTSINSPCGILFLTLPPVCRSPTPGLQVHWHLPLNYTCQFSALKDSGDKKETCLHVTISLFLLENDGCLKGHV